jgi:hypothetical protein
MIKNKIYSPTKFEKYTLHIIYLIVVVTYTSAISHENHNKEDFGEDDFYGYLGTSPPSTQILIPSTHPSGNFIPIKSTPTRLDIPIDFNLNQSSVPTLTPLFFKASNIPTNSRQNLSSHIIHSKVHSSLHPTISPSNNQNLSSSSVRITQTESPFSSPSNLPNMLIPTPSLEPSRYPTLLISTPSIEPSERPTLSIPKFAFQPTGHPSVLIPIASTQPSGKVCIHFFK